MSTSTNKQARSEIDKEKARLMSGRDITQEKQEHEDNKRTIGCCISDFTIQKELGRGSYGVVYKTVSNIDKKEYVMKKINIKHMNSKHQKEALKEAQILRKVKSENIIRYYTSFMENDCLYIIMEYADGGDLQQLLRYRREKKKQFSEQEVWEFAIDLIKAVDYLHKNNIIHRDIKTLNIFLTKDRKVKLGDLGVSKIVSSQAALQGTRVGTPLYLSPELVKQQPYDFKIDIWAIGIVLYHISALEPPFSGENLIALGFNIVNKQPKPLSNLYSPKLCSFINKLLEKNPAARPKTSELIEGFPKRNDRPMTASATVSVGGGSSLFQNQNSRTSFINDKMEVFDKGNYNLLNKIIEEDSVLATHFGGHLFDQNKKQSIELTSEHETKLHPSMQLHHVHRPQTSISRDKQKNLHSNVFHENITNDYNNINLKHPRVKQTDIFTDFNNHPDDNHFQNVKNNNNRHKERIQSPQELSSSSSSSSDNSKKIIADDKHSNNTANPSQINRNVSKTKEIMTYNNKKLSLITDDSGTLEAKKKTTNIQSHSKVKAPQTNVNPISDDNAFIQPEETQHSQLGPTKGQKGSDQFHSKQQVSSEQPQLAKKKSQQDQGLNNQKEVQMKEKEEENYKGQLLQRKGQLQQKEQRKIAVEMSNNDKEMKDVRNEIKGYNPLVAYFNISKSMSDNVSTNFKIRPFSAQTKLSSKDVTKKLDSVFTSEIPSNMNKDTAAGKLEQIIKEFKQEAQKIRETPVNMQSNQKTTNSTEKKHQLDKKNIDKSTANKQPHLHQNNDLSKPIQSDNPKKNNALYPSEKTDEVLFLGNQNLIRPQSAHPLIGQRQNKVIFNQFNNRYVSGVSSNQIITGFNSPFQTNSNTSHKSIVNNFIKNSIGQMNNNVIVNHIQKPSSYKDESENNQENHFFYRIDNVQRDSNDEVHHEPTKSSTQKMDVTSKTKSFTSTNFYKDPSSSLVKGLNSTNIQGSSSILTSQQRDRQNPPPPPVHSGKVLLLNNQRPSTASGIRKKYTIKDLVSDQAIGYCANEAIRS